MGSLDLFFVLSSLVSFYIQFADKCDLTEGKLLQTGDFPSALTTVFSGEPPVSTSTFQALACQMPSVLTYKILQEPGERRNGEILLFFVLTL